jgi:hypothetical protein
MAILLKSFITFFRITPNTRYSRPSGSFFIVFDEISAPPNDEPLHLTTGKKPAVEHPLS